MAQRTCRIEQWEAGVEPLRGGEVVVPLMVRHPERGLVDCRGAELLGGVLRCAGREVRYSSEPLELERRGAIGPDRRTTAGVWLMSYLDRDERAVGMAGALAAGSDPGLLRQALEAWRSVIRTRRLVVADIGPLCMGALRARSALRTALAEEAAGPVFVLEGSMTGPAEEPRAVATADRVPPGAVVVVGAAGAPLAEHAVLAAGGARVVDATCPLVAAAQSEVRRFADQGETVVLVGRPGHAVIPGLVGQAPEAVRVVQDPAGVPTVRVADPGRVAVVLAPGIEVRRTQPLAEAVRTRFGHVLPQHPATYCHEADDRAHALARLAVSCDIVLVAGRDTAATVAALDAAGAPGYPVESVADLRPHWFARIATIGLVEAPGAAPGLTAALLRALQSLGPFAVERQQTATVLSGSDLRSADPVGVRPGESRTVQPPDRSALLRASTARAPGWC